MARQKLFKNLKLQEKYAMWLTEFLQAEEVEPRTGRYRVLKTTDQTGFVFWFLGKSGAVRTCRTNAATKSIDVSGKIKKAFSDWETKKLAENQ